MNIVKTIDQYNESNVFFCEPIKNNIMNEGNFIRIMYSNPMFILNGIYLHVCINYTGIEKYYNKYKCSFDTSYYKDTIEKVRLIERSILKKSGIQGKTPQYKIYEQLNSGSIKLFSDSIEHLNNMFLLKIAGIWETDTDYGLTFKFIKI